MRQKFFHTCMDTPVHPSIIFTAYPSGSQEAEVNPSSLQERGEICWAGRQSANTETHAHFYFAFISFFKQYLNMTNQR